MNSLKNILFFGLLMAVLCGVYLSLNRTPENKLPSSFETPPLKVEIPGLSGAPLSPTSSAAESSGIPHLPAQPPTISMPSTDSGGAAPPFQPAMAVSSTTAAPSWPSQADALPPPPSAQPSPFCVQPSTPPGGAYPSGVRNPVGARDVPPQASPDALTAPPSGERPQADSQNAPPAAHSASNGIDGVMQQVRLKVKENRLGDALLILSQLYGSPDLSASQSRLVTQILDQLSGKVIYSGEHWLESPYLMQSGDTLESIAQRYQVPALVLARINHIRDPQNLPPGKELKVIKGPFSAQVSTERSEMTLWLADRYAVRFSVVLSSDLDHATNLLSVRDKRPPSPVPGNGTSKQWIELGSNAGGNTVSIEGTNDTGVASRRDSRGTIWLSEQDMDDVFGMLSIGSRVIIQR